MVAFSKLEKDKNESDDHHHVTNHRILFIGSSMLSLITWTVTLVFYYNSSKRTINETETCYLLKNKLQESKKAKSLIKTLQQLIKILKKCLTTQDFCFATGVAIALILRTMCDLWMIQNGTQIEAAIITSDFKKLKSNIVEFLYAAPILALVNNGLKYCVNRLKLNLRYKITSYLTKNYLNGMTYYRMNVLENKFQNIDQLLTNDVEKFSHTFVEIYSNIAKPILDILIYIRKLSLSYTSLWTPAIMIGYLILSGGILTNVRKPLTRMILKESQLEGELRFVHSRLISNCEEIAFYQGNKREQITLMNALDRLRGHLMEMLIYKFNVDYFDNMMFRYLGTICGYLALSLPFLSNRYVKDNQTQKQETYYKSGRIMINLAMAMQRLVSASKDLNRLSAYTQVLTDFIEDMTIEQNNKQKVSENTMTSINYTNVRKQLRNNIEYCDPYSPLIQMINVPLCTPSGELLVDSLNFKILIGQNVIITGPNGSGKSSFFRILGELWPLKEGKLIKPNNDRLFYIPQKPYMALGTFRDQIIYPDTKVEMNSKQATDEDLKEILRIVKLEYLLERESTFDSIQDWNEVLSGGEKQRLAIARLIYQKPQFAILDECTSAVSIDVEQSIYEYLSDRKFCSLLSVTHRVKQLQKYHHYILKFDGNGSYSFENLFDLQ